MFDPVGVFFRDLKVSGSFYEQVLETLGMRLLEDHTQPDGTGWLVFGTRPRSTLLRGSRWTTIFLEPKQRSGSQPRAYRVSRAFA